MKLKKSVKIVLVVAILLIGAGLFFIAYDSFAPKKAAKTATVVNQIEEYGYTLKSTRNDTYKDMFQDLQNILNSDEVDEEAYLEQISKMFVYDFFNLSDKLANTDVGGIDFVYSSAKTNFLEKAEDTVYKYVESDIYDNRDQELPVVDSVNVDKIETVSYTIGTDVTDDNAYQVSLSWTYKKDLGYQTAAVLTFVHEDNKLALVEMTME